MPKVEFHDDEPIDPDQWDEFEQQEAVFQMNRALGSFIEVVTAWAKQQAWWASGFRSQQEGEEAEDGGTGSVVSEGSDNPPGL